MSLIEAMIKAGWTKDDLISRQAAIDAAVKMFEAWYGGSVSRDREIRARFDVLPSAQQEQRWIPLGRPMSGGMYLVTLRQKFEGEETYRVRIMRLNNGRWVLPKHFPEWINEEMEQEVLAWMPLPKPYREDGEANESD